VLFIPTCCRTRMEPHHQPRCDPIDYQLLRLGSNVFCASQTLLRSWKPTKRTNGDAFHLPNGTRSSKVGYHSGLYLLSKSNVKRVSNKYAISQYTHRLVKDPSCGIYSATHQHNEGTQKVIARSCKHKNPKEVAQVRKFYAAIF
jgi:hypothetical protein